MTLEKRLLEEADELLISDAGTRDKLDAIVTLSGCTEERGVFELLIGYAIDPDMGETTIATLSQVGDSRALFPLINIFNNTPYVNLHRAVLDYVRETGDPRAEAFLTEQLETSHDYRELANEALQSVRAPKDFLYRFAGSNELFEQAAQKKGRVLMTPEALDANQDTIEEHADTPATYIVDSQGKVFIGGHLQEHVYVAQGEDILAGGELEVHKEGGLWTVSYANNRSNGYYPDKSSFSALQSFFAHSPIEFEKEEFDEVFPIYGYNDQEFLNLHALPR